MTPKQNVAQIIINEIRKDEYLPMNSLIANVSKKADIGSTTVRDVLSQMVVLKILTKRSVGRAQVHTVNEEKVDEIKKIED